MYGRYPMLAEKRKALARTLSGGQRQILAMAMGLMNAPSLLLLDEPTAGLSPKAADELFDAIVALNKGGLPILMVEQHALEALEISTRGYVLVSGRNSREGRGPPSRTTRTSASFSSAARRREATPTTRHKARGFVMTHSSSTAAACSPAPRHSPVSRACRAWPARSNPDRSASAR